MRRPDGSGAPAAPPARPRSPLARRPVATIAGATSALAVAVLAASLLAPPTSALRLGTATMLLLDVCGVVACLVTARRCRGAERAAFACVAGLFACWGVARATLLVALADGEAAGDAAAPDLLWGGSAVMGATACLLLYAHHRSRRSLAGPIDGAVVAIALAIVAWELVVAGGDDVLDASTSAAYLGIVGGCAAIFAGMVAWRRSSAHRWLRWGLIATIPLMADMALTIAADEAGIARLRVAAAGIGLLAQGALIIMAVRRRQVDDLPEPADSHVRTPRPLALRLLPAVALLVAIGALAWDRGAVGALALLAAALLLIRVQRAQATVEALLTERSRWAVTDPLTGAYNRRRLADQLPAIAAQSRRSGIPASVIALDLDNFKTANDTRGHAVGDAVLREVAAATAEVLRGDDQLFRVGGDEFVILLPSTRLEHAERIAERVREAVERAALELLPDGPTVTTSVGVAELPKELRDGRGTPADADRALYAAKVAGRNRVVAADELSAAPD